MKLINILILAFCSFLFFAQYVVVLHVGLETGAINSFEKNVIYWFGVVCIGAIIQCFLIKFHNEI